MKIIRSVVLLPMLLGGGCDTRQPGAAADAVSLATAIDSIFPMEEMIERFQHTQPHEARVLSSTASSRDELVGQFAQALRDSSAAALRSLRLDAPEFAFLYFPTSPLAAEPYRQPPELAWLLTEQNGLKGETRLLRRYGGQPLRLEGYTCETEPATEGANRLWRHCTVALTGAPDPVRLFGSILERDGRFKFVSLANDL